MMQLTGKISVESEPNEKKSFANELLKSKNAYQSHQQFAQVQKPIPAGGVEEVKSNASSTTSISSNNDDPVDVEKIMRGEDLRTYLCIKNLPCRYSKEEFQMEINRNHKNRYSHIKYIADRNDQSKRTVNRSYIFIQFKHPLFVLDFCCEF